MGILIDQLFYSDQEISEEKYNCFFFDMGENIHFHYRDLRIELSVAEFHEMMDSIERYKGDVMQEIAAGYQDGVLPNTNEHHTVKTFWNKERLQHPIKYNAQRISIEENTDGFHIHFRHYKLLLDRRSFLHFAEGMAQAWFKLKNKAEPDPFGLLQINDLFPKLLVKTTTEASEELKIAVQKKYWSKTRQVLEGLGYMRGASTTDSQVFRKEDKTVIAYLQSQSETQDNSAPQDFPSTPRQTLLDLYSFIARIATQLDSTALNYFKLQMLSLFKQAQKQKIPAFSLDDIGVNSADNRPRIHFDPFNPNSVDGEQEYQRLLDLFSQHHLFMSKPEKQAYNANYIEFVNQRFQQFIQENLASLPYVQKVYLFGSATWEKAGAYAAPFVHYDWVKMGSDFDILIEIDETQLQELPEDWDKKFFYSKASCDYYHLGDLGNSQSLPIVNDFPDVTFYQHLIEAYLFFPSKGERAVKDEFVQNYKGQVLYEKEPLEERLNNSYGLKIEKLEKFAVASHNQVFKVQALEQDGLTKSYVYKIYNHATSLQAGLVKYEIALLNRLQTTGLELAYPIPQLNGEYIHTQDANEAVLFQYVSGDFSQQITIEQAKMAAKLLARFHQQADGLDLELTEKFSQVYIYELWINNALKYITQGKALIYSREELMALKRKLSGLGAKESILHGDVAPKNFKFRDSHCVLFDFEQCCQGLRIFDLIDAMIEFSLQNNRCEESIAHVFYQTYCEQYPITEQHLELFNEALGIVIMAKIIRLYRTHFKFNYPLKEDLIRGIKEIDSILAVKRLDKQ